MARLLAFAIVLLGGIAGLFLWLASEPAERVAAAAPAPELQRAGAASGAAVGGTAGQSDAARRGALAAEPAADPATAPADLDWDAVPLGAAPDCGLLIDVVDGPTGEPVAGATLLFADPAQAPYEALLEVDDLAKVDALLVEHGARYVSDERGRALVPRPFRAGTLIGRSGSSFGLISVGTQAARSVLELYPDAPLDARVVDASGQGVEGIPVRLWHRLGKNPSPVTATALSGPDGAVAIPHALWSARQGDKSLKLVARVSGVFREPIEAECPAQPFPTEPLVLVLPPFGSAEVRVTDGGEPAGARLAVALRDFRAGEVSGEPRGEWLDAGNWSTLSTSPRSWNQCTRAWTADGVARFACVELGLELEAASGPEHSMFSVTTVGPGPRSSRERASLELELAERHPIALVDLVDEAGASLGGSRVQVALFSSRPDGGQVDGRSYAAHADAAGRVELPLPGHWEPGWARKLTVTEFVGAGCQRSGTLEFHAPLADAPFEAGKLELELPRLLAAGSVVDGDGRPVQHAVVWAERRTGTPERVRWNRIYPQNAVMGAAGTFEILADGVEGAIRVVAAHADWVGSAVETVAGATGLELRLDASAGARGRVVCEDYVPKRSLRVSAKLADQAPSGGYVTTSWSGAPRADGSFAALGLYPGRYTITVSVGSMRETLATIENVRVAPEAEPDERLDPIDVSGRVRRMAFEVVDIEHNPVQEGWLRWWVPGTNPDEQSRQEGVRDGRVELFTLRDHVDVEAGARDLRRERVPGAHGGERIVLGPPLAVRLMLPAHFEVPDGAALVPQLVDAYGREHDFWDCDEFWDFDEYDRARGVTYHPGHPGTALLSWMLVDVEAWESVALEFEPAQVIEVLDVLEEQRFTLAPPEEAVRKAAEGLASIDED